MSRLSLMPEAVHCGIVDDWSMKTTSFYDEISEKTILAEEDQ